MGYEPGRAARVERRIGRRALAIVCVAASATLSAVVLAGGPAAARAAAFTYTKRTVIVPTKTLHNQLMSVSRNGATYTFRSDVGMLRRLKAGKVMLAQNFAVRDVTKTARSRGHLVVTTTPAKLTDLVANGTVSWKKSLKFTNGFVIGGAAVPRTSSVPARFGMRPLAAGVTLKGTTHSFNYTVKFVASSTGLAATITLTRSSGVQFNGKITGTLKNLKTAGQFAVNHGSFSNAKVFASNLTGQFKLTYSAKAVDQKNFGADNGIKIDLPAEIAIPFFVGPVPMYLGVRIAFFASAGFSDLNQKVSGNWSLGFGGHGGFGVSNSGATTRSGTITGSGGIVLNAANQVHGGAMSFIFGAQMPQLELGLGVKGLDVAGDMTFLGTTGVATFGGGCDTRQIEAEGSGVAQSTFFGLSENATKTLFDKKTQAAFPAGCGNFPS